MPETYDVTTEVGKIRLLISDVGGADGKSFLFTDEEIETFLTMRDTLHRAAATALRVIAGNEVQVQKRITFLELKTDGPALAKELRELATSYESTEDNDADFEVAEFGGEMFSTRERRIRGLEEE